MGGKMDINYTQLSPFTFKSRVVPNGVFQQNKKEGENVHYLFRWITVKARAYTTSGTTPLNMPKDMTDCLGVCELEIQYIQKCPHGVPCHIMLLP